MKHIKNTHHHKLESDNNQAKANLSVEIWQNKLLFKTDSALFSPRQADTGTMALLSQISLQKDDFVLDLGCGYGLAGLAAAGKIGPDRVVMVDINELAIIRSRENARLNHLDKGITILKSDGLSALSDQYAFTKIISNPPYHTDFSVAKKFIEDSYRMLANNGQLWLVVKRLDWYRNKMRAVFGGVIVISYDGYYVLMSEKRPMAMNRQSRIASEKKPTRKHLKKTAKKKRRVL